MNEPGQPPGRGPGARPPDGRPPDPPVSGGLAEAAIGYVGGLLLSVLAVTVAEGARSSQPTVVSIGVLVADLVGLWIGLVAAAAWVSRAKGSGSLVRDFGLRVGAWWDVPAGAAAGLICQFGLIPLLYLPFEQFDHSLAHQLGQPAQADTASVHNVGALAVAVLFLAVGAPIVEELFFRGLVLRSLLRRAGAPVAIVVSALVFALAHFEAVQFPGLAVFGVVLGVLAWRTGRLGPGIAAHAAFNASAVISLAHLH